MNKKYQFGNAINVKEKTNLSMGKNVRIQIANKNQR